jgi:hypothetical protein
MELFLRTSSATFCLFVDLLETSGSPFLFIAEFYN